MAAAGLTAGLTPVELKEVVYQAVPYAGMAKVSDFVHAANDILTERGVQLPLPSQSTATTATRLERGLATQKQIVGGERVDAMYAAAPDDEQHLQRYLSGNCFGDYLTRSGIEVRPANCQKASARAVVLRIASSGYFEVMARPRRSESARVSIGLEVSEADAARIEQVLSRPEFATWTRAEWCLEIVRSALRYYVGEDAVPDNGSARVLARSAAAEPESSGPAESHATAEPLIPAVRTADAAGPSAADGSLPAAPESPAGACSHPRDARDYETGICAACGAILWD